MANCKKPADILSLNGCYKGDDLKILQFLNYNVLAIVENGKELATMDLSEYMETVDEFSLNPIKIGAGETRILPYNPNSNGANTETINFDLSDLQFGYDIPPTRTQTDIGANFDVSSVITDITCNKLNDYGNNEATGSIVATATEPTATYVWTDSNFNEIGTTNTLTGLVPGTYTAVISSDPWPDMTITVDVLTSVINNEIEIQFKTSDAMVPDWDSIPVTHTFNTNYYINDACSFNDFITALGQYFDATPYDDGGNTVVPTLTNLAISNIDETLKTFTITNITTGESIWYDITATLKGGNFAHTSGEVVANIGSFDFSTWDWTSIGSNSVVMELGITEDPNIPLMFDTSFFDNDVTTFAEFIAALQSFIDGGSYTDAYGITQTSNAGDYISLENVDLINSTFELHSTANDKQYSYTVTPNLNVAIAPFDVTGITMTKAIDIVIDANRYITGSIKSAFILAEFCDQCSSGKYEWAYLVNPCTGSTTDLLWQTAGQMLSLSGAEDLSITSRNKIPPIAVRNTQDCDIWLNVIIVQ